MGKTTKTANRILIIASITIISMIIIILVCYFNNIWVFSRETSEVREARALKESWLQVNGLWTTFEQNQLDVLFPRELGEVKNIADVDLSKISYICDESGFITQSVGTILGKEEESEYYALEADPFTVIDSVRAQLTATIEKVFRSGNVSSSYDVSIINLPTGEPCILLSGSVTMDILLQDSKNPAKAPYTESVTTNLLAYIIVRNNRPIMAWGTYDYSVLEGESDTTLYLLTAIQSILERPATPPVVITTYPGGAIVNAYS